MRINDRKSSKNLGKDGATRPIRNSGETNSAPFASALRRITEDQADNSGKLLLLKQQLDKAGDTLEHEPTVVNFKVFRDLLATIARTISSSAYRMELVGDSISPKLLEVMTVVDREADSLYHLIMKEQKDHLRITAQIMKIKGLLVDVML